MAPQLPNLNSSAPKLDILSPKTAGKRPEPAKSSDVQFGSTLDKAMRATASSKTGATQPASRTAGQEQSNKVGAADNDTDTTMNVEQDAQDISAETTTSKTDDTVKASNSETELANAEATDKADDVKETQDADAQAAEPSKVKPVPLKTLALTAQLAQAEVSSETSTGQTTADTTEETTETKAADTQESSTVIASADLWQDSTIALAVASQAVALPAPTSVATPVSAEASAESKSDKRSERLSVQSAISLPILPSPISVANATPVASPQSNATPDSALTATPEFAAALDTQMAVAMPQVANDGLPQGLTTNAVPTDTLMANALPAEALQGAGLPIGLQAQDAKNTSNVSNTMTGSVSKSDKTNEDEKIGFVSMADSMADASGMAGMLDELNGEIELSDDASAAATSDFSSILALVNTGSGSSDMSGVNSTESSKNDFATFLSNASSPVDQVADGTVHTLKQGQRELIIRLNPDNLGEVKINLTTHAGGGLSAKLIASNPESASLLESQAQQLQASLEAKGVKLEKLQVIIAGQESSTISIAASQEAGKSSLQSQQQEQHSEQFNNQQEQKNGQHMSQQQQQNDERNQAFFANQGQFSQQHQRQNGFYGASTQRTAASNEVQGDFSVQNQPVTNTETSPSETRTPGRTSILA